MVFQQSSPEILATIMANAPQLPSSQILSTISLFALLDLTKTFLQLEQVKQDSSHLEKVTYLPYISILMVVDVIQVEKKSLLSSIKFNQKLRSLSSSL